MSGTGIARPPGNGGLATGPAEAHSPFLLPDTSEPGCDTRTIVLRKPSLNLSRPDALLNTVAVTFLRVPAPRIEAPGIVGYRASLHGTVRKSGGAQITLTLNVNGTLRTLEYPYHQEIASEDTSLLEVLRWEWISDRERRDDPIPVPSLAVTITAASQRRTREEIVLLQMERLDIQAVRA